MTKIDVISGFLGAGKTTFIKLMIDKLYKGERIVLIENEFGEVGIDSGFLKDAEIEISELNSGCICCSLVGDFGKNLREVLTRFTPDRIIIEPSGVGKLSDVIKSIKEVNMDHEIEIQGLVTIVNTKKALKQMKSFGEFFNNQIEYANTIVFSRTQDLNEKIVLDTAVEVQKKNSHGKILTTPWEQLSKEQLLEVITRENNLEKKLMEEQKHHECGCGCQEHKHHHEHGKDCGCQEHKRHHEHGKDCGCQEHKRHHEHGKDCDSHDNHHHHAEDVFTSWGIETPKKFEDSEIEYLLKSFRDTEDYGSILRAKGMVNSTGEQWIYFDFVDGDYEIREGSPDYTGRICVIGTNVVEDKLTAYFQ